MQGTTLANQQPSWVSMTGWWKLIPRVVLMCAVTLLVSLQLLGVSWLAVIVGIALGAGITLVIFVWGRRRGETRMAKYAPDRITIEPDRVLAHFDTHPGPGGVALATVPFAAITEIRLREKSAMVVTTWGKSSAKVIWDSPPIVPDRNGGSLPAAAILNLTRENGQQLSNRWNAWKFPASPPVVAPRPVTYGASGTRANPPSGQPLVSSASVRPPPGIACPSCGGPLDYVAQYGRNYCRTCGQYV